MTMQIEDFDDRENSMLQDIDRSIEDAGRILDMDDATEENYEELYENRYHCGTCTVRVVMETVWPSVDAYISFLKQQGASSAAHAAAVAALDFFTEPDETKFNTLSAALDRFAKGM